MGAQSCNIILLNDRHEVLLQLRDDIPTIAFPNRWCLPGGYIEEGETPEQCIRREMNEELGLDLKAVRFIGAVDRSYGTENTFWTEANFEAETIDLAEGQRIAWFARQSIERMPLAYEDNRILADFYQVLDQSRVEKLPAEESTHRTP